MLVALMVVMSVDDWVVKLADESVVEMVVMLADD